MTIPLPDVFNRKLLFQYLLRSPNEITFRIINKTSLVKLFQLSERLILCQLEFHDSKLTLSFKDIEPNLAEKQVIKAYCISWFDLETDLEAFYEVAEKDSIINPIIKNQKGLRMVKAPDHLRPLAGVSLGSRLIYHLPILAKKL